MAIDNGAVDTLRSMTAKGLLATLLRARDGDEITVEGLCKTHDEGRETLTKAMRALVTDAFVVKFKVQRSKSEVVELEDGRKETKRGGSWYTTFTADSIPFTLDDIATMLEDIQAGGNVKAIRVEPAHLDPRKAAGRPTAGKPSVGATRPETKNPQVAPTDGKPTVGRPTVGRSAAKKIKTGVEEDSLSDSRDSRDGADEREAAAPEPVGADVVVDAYEAAAGRRLMNGTRASLRTQAVEVLAAGRPVAWVAARAAEMPAQGWTDLIKHCERSRVPIPGQATGPDAGAFGGARRGEPDEATKAAMAAILARGSGL
ncbi:hypothetical protein [[Kitasatospora] papulosa]|uniref:hypothetical protein n=1 Tax=[Kitasatospora] papulosa TaxID=1464011 RepID=UPI0036C7587A